MSKKIIISIAVVIIVIIACFGIILLIRLAATPKYSGPVDKITIAVSSQPISALIYIAQAKNYFRDQGLDVTLQGYSTGKEALQATADKKADLGTVADTPFVIFSLNSTEKIDIISTIGTSDENLAIVARKDKGILNPIDLTGKKIGVTLGTNGQYFLDSFLRVNGIKKKRSGYY